MAPPETPGERATSPSVESIALNTPAVADLTVEAPSEPQEVLPVEPVSESVKESEPEDQPVAPLQPASSLLPSTAVTAQKRRLIIWAAVIALLGTIVFATRACASKRDSAPRDPNAQGAATPEPTLGVSKSSNPETDEKKPEPAQTRTATEPTAAATAEPATSEATPPAEEATIQVVVKPNGTQFYYKGKVVGRTPFVLKQPRDEKRTYEVVKAGYASRRVVVTGNEKMIGFELQQVVPHPDSL